MNSGWCAALAHKNPSELPYRLAAQLFIELPGLPWTGYSPTVKDIEKCLRPDQPPVRTKI